MKFSIDIDCTPQEARTFLGLPDVERLQNEMMDAIKDRLAEHLKAMDSEGLMKAWIPMGLGTMEAMQKAFAASFGTASKASDDG